MMSTFTLRGDGHDLAEKFEDTLRELISDNNVFEFMSEDIDAPEPYSVDNESVRQKQRASVGKMVTALIKIAQPDSTLRSTVRKVETTAAYSTPVQKMRKLIDLYREQVKPNPAKNGVLTEKRAEITLKITSAVQLKEDVLRLLNEIITVETEMEQHAKWSEVSKMENIVSLLEPVEDLNKFFHTQNIYDSATSYDLFHTRLLEACTGIVNTRRRQKVGRGSQSIMSSNSTEVSKPSSNSTENSTMVVDSTEFKEFQDYKRQRNRDRSNSNDRYSRADSKDRRTPSPSSSRRARFSGRSRSRSNDRRRDQRRSSSPANRSAMRQHSQFGNPSGYQAWNPYGNQQQGWNSYGPYGKR